MKVKISNEGRDYIHDALMVKKPTNIIVSENIGVIDTDTPLGKMLIKVVKLDVGLAKQARIAAYVRRAYQLGLQNTINLKKLCKLSRKELVEQRVNLKNE